MARDPKTGTFRLGRFVSAKSGQISPSIYAFNPECMQNTWICIYIYTYEYICMYVSMHAWMYGYMMLVYLLITTI